MSEENETADAFKSTLQIAVENNSVEHIAELSKSETVFYLCHALETETPADHPSTYDGQVTRETLQEWAIATTEADESDE